MWCGRPTPKPFFCSPLISFMAGESVMLGDVAPLFWLTGKIVDVVLILLFCCARKCFIPGNKLGAFP